jgi:uncharacterized protein (TIGR02145 family)
MRKLLLTTAAVAAAIGLAVAGEPSFGTFTDTRDGQTYKTVKMPDGKTWIAQNMNYWMEDGKSWCYKYDTSYCNKYGRLYTWYVAMIHVCPSGYHLPSRKEWVDLVKAVGGKQRTTDIGFIFWVGAGKKLKAKHGWNNRDDGSSGNGTDDYGFSALPGGRYSEPWIRQSDIYSFRDTDDGGMWWTATMYNANDREAYGWNINKDDNMVFDNINSKKNAFSVRCVADRP